jgi:hypothetical protein
MLTTESAAQQPPESETRFPGSRALHTRRLCCRVRKPEGRHVFLYAFDLSSTAKTFGASCSRCANDYSSQSRKERSHSTHCHWQASDAEPVLCQCTEVSTMTIGKVHILSDSCGRAEANQSPTYSGEGGGARGRVGFAVGWFWHPLK